MKKVKYDVWSLDVWGNEEEGFEVNDRTCFARDVEFPTSLDEANEQWPTKEQILNTLMEVCMLRMYMMGLSYASWRFARSLEHESLSAISFNEMEDSV